MAASITGGQLVQRLEPASALHTAAAIIALAPLAVMLSAVFLISEKKSAVNFQELKATLRSLGAAVKERELWLVGFFILFYNFSPGFGTPLYYYMTDDLKFSQAYIGILGSIASAGWVTGALLYRRFFEGFSSKNLLYLSIVLGTVTTVSYLLLSNELSAAVLNFCSGFSAMVAMVATLTLAADFSPKRAEGFSFAVLMSLANFAAVLADNVGSFLYDKVFHSSLTLFILPCPFSTVRREARSHPASRRQAAGPAGRGERRRRSNEAP